eukprot:Nk52_evm12s240 gene=Nk52_evmTU12s240
MFACQLKDLEGYCLERVLKDDMRGKVIYLLGSFKGKEGQAILTLERQHFSEKLLSSILSKSTCLENVFENDIYSKYTAGIAKEAAEININCVYPCTEKHIKKYETQDFVMFHETAEIYNSCVEPYINSIPTERINWVYNILSKKAEAERMIYENTNPETGFVLHPDLKWDEQQITNLYCLAIVHRRDIKSLRDLRQSHLSLLKTLRSEGSDAIQKKYGVGEGSLRIFVHYHPSYYHFHVHYVHVGHSEPPGAVVGKAVLLDDIINNIELFSSDYYARMTLSYHVGKETPLYQQLSEAKHV